MVKNVLVYCGSATGHDSKYREASLKLAQSIVNRNLGLVYGGGNVGLMGIIADEVLRLGGQVIGVIPQLLMEKEVGHTNLTELIIVDDMHQRKAKMFELSNVCIALPGGVGTMEELFEAFTWNQLGFHHKPCGILNVDGYYDALNQLMQEMVNTGFLIQTHKDQLLFETNEEVLLDKLLLASNYFE